MFKGLIFFLPSPQERVGKTWEEKSISLSYTVLVGHNKVTYTEWLKQQNLPLLSLPQLTP